MNGNARGAPEPICDQTCRTIKRSLKLEPSTFLLELELEPDVDMRALRRLSPTLVPRVRRTVQSARCILSDRNVRLSSLAPSQIYGAPFTNSIKFAPAEQTREIIQQPQSYLIQFSIPNLPPAAIRVHAHDKLEKIAKLVEDELHCGTVDIFANGRKLTTLASAESSLKDLFGQAVDFGVDGVRYSVNVGLRLSPLGSTVKRTLLLSYIYLFGGASALVCGSLLFWNIVVPKGHNRLKQMQR